MKPYLAKVQPVWRSSFLRKTGQFLISENGTIIIFAILGLIGISHHEMWRDEMQAWLLAKDSPSIAALYQNTVYEGHPLLWHICLYGLAKISHSPFMMQGFHLLVSIGSFALIVKTSPFSWLQKRLFGFSYFIFYEYSVISRSYALGVFLAFLFCALYQRSEVRSLDTKSSEETWLTQPVSRRSVNTANWLLVTLLVLLANISVMGLIISFGLGSLLLFRISTTTPLSVAMRSHLKNVRPSPKLSVWLQQMRRGLPYALVLIAGWILCLLQSGRVLPYNLPFADAQNLFAEIRLPVAHSSQLIQDPLIQDQLVQDPLIRGTASLGTAVDKAVQSIKDIVNPNLAINKFSQFISAGYFILPPLPLFSIDFWNRHLFSSLDVLPFIDFAKIRFISITTTLAGVGAAIKSLWKTPRYLLLYVITTSLLTVLHLFFYTGSIRHYGHFLIVLVACLWLSTPASNMMASGKTPRRRPRKKHWLAPCSFSSAFLTILLSIQAFTGIYAYTIDLIYPFSNSLETAQYIQSHQLENEVLFGYDDRKVVGVAGYLDRSLYFPNRESFGSFWRGEKPKLETPQAVASSIDTFSQQQPSFIAITTGPIAADLTAANLTELARFDRAIRQDEHFYIYRVTAR